MNALALVLLAALPPLPATPKKPVVDTYFGVKVSDDYRWLEDWSDPAAQKWSEGQNARARAVLDALPGRDALSKRLTELLTFESPSYSRLVSRGAVVFAMKFQPPRQQPLLVVLPALDDLSKERVLFDPMALDPTGATAVDFFVPSLDGKRLAISLSKGGTERGDVHVYDVATAKEQPADTVPGVNTGTAGGSLAWTKDGFFYTRHPHDAERPKADLDFYQQVGFHKLGTSAATDTIPLGKDFLRIAENFLATSDDGKWAADLVQKGDGGEFELWLLPPGGAWAKVASYDDRIVAVAFGLDPALYLLSKKDAPKGKVLRLPLATPALDKATVVVPQGEATIAAVRPTVSRLYLTEQLGGPSRVRMVDLTGKELGLVPAPQVASNSSVEKLGGDDVVFRSAGYLSPPSWLRWDSKAAKVAPTALAVKAPVDLTQWEVVRDECVSKDGTKIPLNIVRAKGLTLDGSHPAWLTGYGGFGISMAPAYWKALPAWLEVGGVFAEANLRGGGEFGESWHQQGMLATKQNVFDDFAACAKRLVDAKYTSVKKLAVEGASNGGLLMGAFLTQHPELAHAVIAQVGYYDMLRYETAANGVFNTTEYGSVKDEAAFKYLQAYSPYQQVKDGTQYPASLMLTGANDPRVAPFHSRKMVARLQASGTKAPVLLRTSGSTGHGLDTPLTEQIAEQVDIFGFLCDALGIKVPPGKVPR